MAFLRKLKRGREVGADAQSLAAPETKTVGVGGFGEDATTLADHKRNEADG